MKSTSSYTSSQWISGKKLLVMVEVGGGENKYSLLDRGKL